MSICTKPSKVNEFSTSHPAFRVHVAFHPTADCEHVESLEWVAFANDDADIQAKIIRWHRANQPYLAPVSEITYSPLQIGTLNAAGDDWETTTAGHERTALRRPMPVESEPYDPRFEPETVLAESLFREALGHAG